MPVRERPQVQEMLRQAGPVNASEGCVPGTGMKTGGDKSPGRANAYATFAPVV